MMRKQHRGFKNRLLAVLFLFFNCVCIAAPVAKFNDDSFKDAISLRTGPTESEETHVSSGYINHIGHLSVDKQPAKQNHHFSNNKGSDSTAAIESTNAFISIGNTLPLPGTHAFLFRFNLF